MAGGRDFDNYQDLACPFIQIATIFALDLDTSNEWRQDKERGFSTSCSVAFSLQCSSIINVEMMT